MLELYSYDYDNNNLIINEPFNELWSIMKFKGKYIQFPEEKEEVLKKLPDKVIMNGKLRKDKKFYFKNQINDIITNNYGNEIQLSVDYEYEIQWEINCKCKCGHNNIDVGFYSPYRKFSNDRLYLNFDKNKNELAKYKNLSGMIKINCHILVIALNKYHSNTDINLIITPKIKKTDISSFHNMEYCKVKIFDLKKDGIFYYLEIKKEFKKLYKLVKKYYELNSIERNIYKYHICSKNKFDINLPKDISYTGILTKMSYGDILSFTSNIQPINDRVGYYGIIIKRDPNVISSATIYYEFELSNIRETRDVIVYAGYYQASEGYAIHQIYKDNEYIDVKKIHEEKDGPYPSKSNYITGELKLESSSVDVILIISNSLYGILPINENLPIGRFTKFKVEYDNVQR